MNNVIIYKSKYGSAKKYATWLNEMTNFPIKELKEVNKNNIDNYNNIVYCGSLYAGVINGVKELLKVINPNQKVVLLIVGFTRPSDTEFYKSVFENNIPENIRSQFTYFAVQGDLMLTKMSFLEKSIMKMFQSQAKKKNVENRTQEDNDLIERFGSDIYYSSQKQLETVYEHLNSL